MDDCIRICMLGEFTIAYKDKVISDELNRSKKVWTLLEYLIAFHNKEISQFTLIDVLWPDDSNADPLNSLKTILHRARTLLEEIDYPERKLIVHRRDTYAWNNSLNFTLDADEFESLCQKAANTELDSDERIKLYYEAYHLYRGEFLPKSSQEPWAVSLSTHYQSLYTKAVYELSALLEQAGRYEEIITVCSTASSFDPYDEQSHYLLIHSLYHAGKQKQAVDKYKSVMSLFYDKFGITPSQQLTDLYETITKSENTSETDLSIIQSDLKELNAERRAYYCEYSVFQNLYRIEARSAARSGLSIFLCLITIENNTRHGTNTDAVGTAMTRMNETIAVSLRSGDVFSRYSINQFIIMLPSTSYENCTMIGERILKHFDNVRPKLSVIVSYNLKHLEPSEFIG